MKKLNTCILTLLVFCSTSIIAQVPILNSYPSASAVIFLDFDGHTVNGTSWNSSGPIFCGPSNLNSTQIKEVFDRVAEDYRPFNINITTDSTKYWNAPANKRMRVINTISWEWYGRAGGVAYTNSFTWGDNTPCFVFTSLHNYSTKNIAEAASHEAGHTFGLRHQSRYDPTCYKTEEYNSGAGAGEVGWAPIMGVGYYRNLTTWHNGPNSYGCNNTQDDLSILTNATNGFGYRTDDHANTFKNATVLNSQNNSFISNGLITASSDDDMFKINIPASSKFKMDVAPYSAGVANVGSNLDIKINLYNGNEQLINTYNPTELLSASIDTTLGAGTYYFSVSGSSNNYTTNYASLGEYTVNASYGVFNPLPLRQLNLKGNVEGDKHKFNWIIDADEKVVKQVLEVSVNGRDFEVVTPLSNDVRTYVYLPASTNTLQYRVNVTFDNDRQYYSNVIALRNNKASKPQLFTNIIQGNTLMVSSPATYAYTIADFNGKIVSKGQIIQGASSINTVYLASGMYIIRFNNGSEEHIEKFTKQ